MFSYKEYMVKIVC